ncbi:stonustoxin subunit beta-like isoform X1 [Astyanax mexicanus]|uniref:stonustoxin subunit beta-like isoform X1 n=1 Tax=Astyanax mexicanus TaxID=7994 RepID=UPI0020CAB4D4|nr:stonustoxin subunit beta-like isoform X1 [Astyanax mexicanus]
MNTIPKKYACKLTLDQNTAHRRLQLSDSNTRAVHQDDDLPYPDHPDRFCHWEQVLSVERLTGRCYWEVEWTGRVEVAVCYAGIRRRDGSDCLFGLNDQSWRLYGSRDGYNACHNNHLTPVQTPLTCSGRVAVYLDWEAGQLTFYSISPRTHALIPLHTYSTTFTQPLLAGFRVYEYSALQICEII